MGGQNRTMAEEIRCGEFDITCLLTGKRYDWAQIALASAQLFHDLNQWHLDILVGDPKLSCDLLPEIDAQTVPGSDPVLKTERRAITDRHFKFMGI